MMIVVPVRMPVAVAVTMPAAVQEPRARDVNGQAETSNGDRLCEVNGTGAKIRLTDS